MNSLIFTLSIMITTYNKIDYVSSQTPIVDDNVYIYEFAIKKPGRTNFGFIIIDGNMYQDISFDIHFSEGKINKIKKAVTPFYPKNNIIKKIGSSYLSSEDFVRKRRFIPDNIYKMISPSFLEVTNKERLQILNELSQ